VQAFFGIYRFFECGRERSEYLKKTEEMFTDKIAAFQARSAILFEENQIRAHALKSLDNEVQSLEREREVVLMEIEELRRESDFEKSAKSHLAEIIAKAQRELKCQRQELTAYRKETLLQVKSAGRLKERMKVYLILVICNFLILMC
jgi:hypothetical protein